MIISANNGGNNVTDDKAPHTTCCGAIGDGSISLINFIGSF